MKSALVLCVLAATAAQAEPYRVRALRFAGDPGVPPDTLQEVLEQLEVRRSADLDAGIARLRSFYISRGYFDATVGIKDVTFDGREATVTVDVKSGPKSRIRQVTVEGLVGERKKIIASSHGDLPVDTLCTCLLEAARDAETHGRIDFAAELEVAEGDFLDVTARVRPGTAHAVGRINFSGHRRVNELTLRRTMTLQERAPFDVGELRRSLARLNQSGLFEPLTPDDVEIQPQADGVTVDLAISLRERRRARWSLSGPVVPGAGSLQAAISSRLPYWGLTLSLIGVANPLARLLPIASNAIPSLLFVVERPYLPGQAPLSGFALSPQRSVRGMLTSYGLTHLGRGVRALLNGETLDASGLLVPVKASALICDPPKPRLWLLRRGAAHAADLALGAFGFQ